MRSWIRITTAMAFAAPPPGGGPPALPGPAGEFAVDTAPIVAGQAKRAAPLLFEFKSAVAAALCAVPVSWASRVPRHSGNRIVKFIRMVDGLPH